MKRVFLFLLTNLAVAVTLYCLMFLLSALGVKFGGNALGYVLFATLFGFGGAIISLLLSKQMAKWSMGIQLIDPHHARGTEKWLYETVAKLAQRANVAMPEVGIYEGEPNAFATGPSRNNSLVGVSSGLLELMDKSEVEAVLAHEMAHIANGDMVTLTLVTGVVNTFAILLSKAVSQLVASTMQSETAAAITRLVTELVCQIAFTLLGSIVVAYVSRIREYKADKGSADLMGTTYPMINALRRLNTQEPSALPANMAALGIRSGSGGWMDLWKTHPDIEDRIAALKNYK